MNSVICTVVFFVTLFLLDSLFCFSVSIPNLVLKIGGIVNIHLVNTNIFFMKFLNTYKLKFYKLVSWHHLKYVITGYFPTFSRVFSCWGSIQYHEFIKRDHGEDHFDQRGSSRLRQQGSPSNRQLIRNPIDQPIGRDIGWDKLFHAKSSYRTCVQIISSLNCQRKWLNWRSKTVPFSSIFESDTKRTHKICFW
jgi:hypothetical protein